MTIGSTRERNQVDALTDIRRMVNALGLDEDMRDQACGLFRTVQEADLLVGRSVAAMSAAAVYAVCRLHERPQTLADIGRVARVSAASVQHAYDVCNRELALPVAPRDPAMFLPWLTDAVGVSPAVERRARALLAGQSVPADRHGAPPIAIGMDY